MPLKNLLILFLLAIVPVTAYGQASKAYALLEPEDGKVYHGACTMTYAAGPDPLAGYLGALNDPSIQPAVRGFFMSVPGERGPGNSFTGLRNFFESADSIGYIPELSLFFVDNRGSTDSIIAVSDTHDWIIDSVIALCRNYGRKIFLRIGGEFNGSGPGWNGGGYHPYLYVSMFRKIVDRFTGAGLGDSIAVNWCYEPDAANDFDSVDQRGARWYPGDGYVDWFGLDVFNSSHFDLALPDFDRRGITAKGKSERFLAFARQKGKPVFMSETSAKGINISNDEQDAINDWNNWFAKFWQFIALHPEIKGFNYVDANWPVGAYPGWGDARIENSVYITGQYTMEMKKPRYIHLPGVVTSTGQNQNDCTGPVILGQNHPNPFNAETSITWQSSLRGQTRLDIYDPTGLKICTLVDGEMDAGRFSVTFIPVSLAPGFYYYRIRIGNFSASKKMLLIRAG